MLFRRIAIVFVALLGVLSAFGQDSIPSADYSFADAVEELCLRYESETPAEDISNLLYELSIKPVHINLATDDELSRLFWLTMVQRKDIREYIRNNGFLHTKYEIAYIQGFTREDAGLILPFIDFKTRLEDDSLSLPALMARGKSNLLIRSQTVLEKEAGYKSVESPTPSNHFVGDPYRHYLRYSFDAGNRFSAGLVAEKDAGEEFFKGSNRQGFDFYSGYVQVSNCKFLKTFILGDYRLGFGQGLVLGANNFSMGRSASVMAQGITHYHSADENRFFRGLAASAKVGSLEVSAWLSAHSVDGNVTSGDTLTDYSPEITSLQYSGIHSTPAQIEDKGLVRLSATGVNLSVVRRYFRSGLTFNGYRFSSPVHPPARLYNQYYFRGRANYNVGWDFRAQLNHWAFYGEHAFSENRGFAMVDGLEVLVSSRLSFSLAGRYYGRSYQSFFASAWGENSLVNNEQGVYMGLVFQPLNAIQFNGYIDMFYFPWFRFRSNMPSNGRNMALQMNISPVGNFVVKLTYRNKQVEENLPATTAVTAPMVNVTTQRVKLVVASASPAQISAQSHVEASFYSNTRETSQGLYLGQTISWQSASVPVKCSAHYGLFDVGQYNARLYVYEPDLPYTFQMNMFSGKGSRACAMVEFKPSKIFSIWLKYSITRYNNKQTIGYGPYQIQGTDKSELKVQIISKF
jgi:hypothetical protein